MTDAVARPSRTPIATAADACDHGEGVCHGDDAGGVCSVEQLATLTVGAGRHPANLQTMERRFAARLRSRFNDIQREIRRLVGEEDIFGLGGDDMPPRYAGQHSLGGVTSPTARDFAFLSEGERHDRFVAWLDAVQDAHVVGVIANGEGRFLERAFDRGERNARVLLRKAERDSGGSSSDQLSPSHTRGSSVEYLQAGGRDSPIRVGVRRGAGDDEIDRRALERIQRRAFHDLDGITDEQSRELSRVLSDAYREGWGPDKTAREMDARVDHLGKHRSTLLARTALMEAHNSAATETYRVNGVERVDVITAAGACDMCISLAQRGPYRIGDADSLVPGRTHPQCRCTVGPAAHYTTTTG